MGKVVREISVKKKRDDVRVVGYSSSDRGSKYVNGVINIDSKGKSPPEINAEVASAIAKLLGEQLGPG